MAPALIPVILAGGKGERFWPLSRQSRPKQFLCLDNSGESLLQRTAGRLLPLARGWDHLWVITAQGDAVQAQLPNLRPDNLLVEPQGWDTGPAVAWAAWAVQQRYGSDAIAGIFPADPWIGDEGALHQTLAAATEVAQQTQGIVTLGIQPAYPATGYGYIERGEPWGAVGNLMAYRVARFTEKPDRATAEAFVASGHYSWNSGMFIFPVGVVLEELQHHAPTVIEPLLREGVAGYAALPKISFDYAVMEKTQRAYVLPATFPWDDLGDWTALERLAPPGAVNVSHARHVALDTRGAIVYASDPQEVVVTLGVDNLVIVRDGAVTLVVAKDRVQDIKKLLAEVRARPDLESLL